MSKTSAGLLTVLSATLAVACGFDASSNTEPNGPGATPDEMPSDPDSEPEPSSSRCRVEGEALSCDHQTVELGPALARREVHFQVPTTPAPASGYPAAIVFQGSLFSAEKTWSAAPDAPFSGYYQVDLTRQLLDRGYAVITPEAHLDGNTFWDTNVPAFAYTWELAPDHRFMLRIFDALGEGVFGPIDTSKLFATGISSGGYMTSRMAVSYPGTFVALAINAGSYATCSGLLCSVPDELPADHPPTLFVHGENDRTVPISTMREYYDKLAPITDTAEVVDDSAHEWLEAAPVVIPDWFDAYL